MKIQLFQMDIQYDNSEVNEKKINTWFKNHVDIDTNVVVLPEMWNNGYALEELDYKSDNHLERSFPFISHLAK